MAHAVFISYSSKDKAIADAVRAVLERNDVRCWIAPRDILPGTTSWASSILAAIEASRLMVLVFSGHCNSSPAIEREVWQAISKGIPVVLMRVENVAPEAALKFHLGTAHWLDAFPPPLDQHLAQLQRAVATLLADQNGSRRPSGAASSIQRHAVALTTQPATRRFALLGGLVGGVVLINFLARGCAHTGLYRPLPGSAGGRPNWGPGQSVGHGRR